MDFKCPQKSPPVTIIPTELVMLCHARDKSESPWVSCRVYVHVVGGRVYFPKLAEPISSQPTLEIP